MLENGEEAKKHASDMSDISTHALDYWILL